VRREAEPVLGYEGEISALAQLRISVNDPETSLFGSVTEPAAEATKKIEERELHKSGEK